MHPVLAFVVPVLQQIDFAGERQRSLCELHPSVQFALRIVPPVCPWHNRPFAVICSVGVNANWASTPGFFISVSFTSHTPERSADVDSELLGGIDVNTDAVMISGIGNSLGKGVLIQSRRLIGFKAHRTEKPTGFNAYAGHGGLGERVCHIGLFKFNPGVPVVTGAAMDIDTSGDRTLVEVEIQLELVE